MASEVVKFVIKKEEVGILNGIELLWDINSDVIVVLVLLESSDVVAVVCVSKNKEELL